MQVSLSSRNLGGSETFYGLGRNVRSIVRKGVVREWGKGCQQFAELHGPLAKDDVVATAALLGFDHHPQYTAACARSNALFEWGEVRGDADRCSRFAGGRI